MPEVRILCFYAEHEAYLAAQQLQNEGIAAFVFDFSLASSPWPGLGFRVLVIPPEEESGEAPINEPEDGSLPTGLVGATLDRFLQSLAFAAIGLFPVLLVILLLKFVSIAGPEPLLNVDHFALAGIAILLWIGGGLASVAIYFGYRKNNLACVTLFQVTALLFALMRFEAAIAVIPAGIALLMSRPKSDASEENSPTEDQEPQ